VEEHKSTLVGVEVEVEEEVVVEGLHRLEQVQGRFSYNDEDKLVVVEELLELAFLGVREVLQVLLVQNLLVLLVVRVVHFLLDLLGLRVLLVLP